MTFLDFKVFIARISTEYLLITIPRTVEKLQWQPTAEREMCILKDFFFAFETHVAKGNRIDREEVREQLQKFQHAKVDRPAVLRYVTRVSPRARPQKRTKRKRENERKKKKYARNVFFSRDDKSSVSSPVSDEWPAEASNESRQGKLPFFSTRCEDRRESFLKSDRERE